MQPSTPPSQAPTMGRTRVVIVLLAAVLVAVVVGDAIVYQATLSLERTVQALPPPGQAASNPVVWFAYPEASGLGERVTIASVSRSVGIQNYEVNLGVNGSVGSPRSMPTVGAPFNVLPIGNAYYRVNWTQTGANTGLLVSGDSFEVTHTNASGTAFSALPRPANFTFYLLWADGSLLSQVSFTVPAPPSPRPSVVLTVSKITGGVSILVAGIQPPTPPSGLMVTIQNVTSRDFGLPVPMPTTSGSSVTVTVSFVTFTIKWQNTGGSGEVSQGDDFVITYGAPTGTAWAFLLIWAADGSVLPTNSQWVV